MESVEIRDDGSVWVSRPWNEYGQHICQQVRAPHGVVSCHYTDVFGQPHEAVEQASVNVLCREIERLRTKEETK